MTDIQNFFGAVVDNVRIALRDGDKEHCLRCGSWYLDTGWECNDCGYDNMLHYAKAAEGQAARVQLNTKPASLPISVTPVADKPLLCVAVGPIWTYVTLGEAVALRAQLDEQIAAVSAGFA